MDLNTDITQAPEGRQLLLKYDGIPVPLAGVRRPDFEGGIAFSCQLLKSALMVTTKMTACCLSATLMTGSRRRLEVNLS